MTMIQNCRSGQSHASVAPACVEAELAALKARYSALRGESRCIHLPIAQRVAAGEQADAVRLVWRALRDVRDGAGSPMSAPSRALVSWSVRFCRVESPQSWVSAAGVQSKSEARELAEALRRLPHVLAVSVTQKVAAGHGSRSGVSVHAGPDQASCPQCIAYEAAWGPGEAW